MEIKVVVLGCGYLGTRLARHFKNNGHQVVGTTRSQEKADDLEKEGLPALVVDLNFPASLKSLPKCDVLIACPAADTASDEAYRKIYQQGMITLSSYVAQQPLIKKYIYTSSTGVYQDFSGEEVDETTLVEPQTPHQMALIKGEESVLETQKGIVIRLGGIYGPGRNRIEAVRQGRPMVQDDFIVNLIHVDDAVGIIDYAVSEIEPGELILGVDSEPVQRAKLVQWLANECNVPSPPFKKPQKQSESRKRCTNKKIKQLGYKFKFPSFRDGYTPLTKEET